jgi:PTS system galactitol-specific IIC component
MAILDFIVGLGPSVMMPILLTIFGMILGASFGKSLRSGLTVGVGFIGLNLVIGLLGGNLGPAAQQMVENFGLSLTTIDVGWPAAAAIAFGSQIGAVIIPIGLIVNVVMLLTNTTQTVNIDIWNYWHFAFTGALVQGITGSFAMGAFAAAMNMIITMVIADRTAPGVEEFLGLPGVSLPHGFSGAYAPIAAVMNAILERIPGINKININPEKVQKKLGVFGEPLIVGTVIGMIIGAMAKYDISKILQLGVTMGGVLILIPRMAAMLMEGLIPISDAAQIFIEKRFNNRGKMYIGLDSAVGIGHPTTLAVALLLTPITIFLALVLPGNTVLPFADLAVIPFMFVLVVPFTKGDFFRTFIIGLVIVSAGLLIATDLAPLHTEMALAANFDMGGATQISSICDGANPMAWGITKLMNMGIFGVGILGVASIGLAVWNRKKIIEQAQAE